MILDIYFSRVEHIGPIRGEARELLRLVRRIQRVEHLSGGPQVVLSLESDLDPSQVALLDEVAEEQERLLRDLYAPQPRIRHDHPIHFPAAGH